MSTTDLSNTAYVKRTAHLSNEIRDFDPLYLLSRLNAENSVFKPLSLREIDRVLFDNRIGFANLSRYLRGDPVVNRDHRRLLLIKGNYRNRIMISGDDAESAAISILTARRPSGEFRASDEFIDRLVELLEANRI